VLSWLMPSAAILSANSKKSASTLANILLTGPVVRAPGELSAAPLLHNWTLIAKAIADGSLPISNPNEVLATSWGRQPLGLLTLGAAWLMGPRMRQTSPTRINEVERDVEGALLALLAEGVRPINTADCEALVRRALAHGADRVLTRLLELDDAIPAIARSWLASEQSFARQFRGLGFHQLAWCGFTDALDVVLDTGLVDVNLCDAKGRNAAAQLLHAPVLSKLAARGLDPLSADSLGRLAPENWLETVPRGQAYVALRKTWSKLFSDHPSLLSSSQISRQMLKTCVVNNPACVLDYNWRTAGLEPGQLLDDHSIAQLVISQSQSKIPCLQLPKPVATTDTALRTWQSFDPARMLPSGVSDGFAFALTPLLVPWSEQQLPGFRKCAESAQSLAHQLASVHRLVSSPDYAGPPFDVAAKMWWSHRNDLEKKLSPSDRAGYLPPVPEVMKFLATPDPNHPHRLPPISQGWLSWELAWVVVRVFGTNPSSKTTDANARAAIPGQDLWMAHFLSLLPDRLYRFDQDPARHHLPMLPRTNGSVDIVPNDMVWMAEMVDRGVKPNAAMLLALGDARTHVRSQWPIFANQWDSWHLDATTAQSVPSKRSPRL
jgi:hypothetical protein